MNAGILLIITLHRGTNITGDERERDLLLVPTDVHSTADGQRGLISKHVHYQLVHGNRYKVPGNSVPEKKITIIIITITKTHAFLTCHSTWALEPVEGKIMPLLHHLESQIKQTCLKLSSKRSLPSSSMSQCCIISTPDGFQSVCNPRLATFFFQIITVHWQYGQGILSLCSTLLHSFHSTKAKYRESLFHHVGSSFTQQ